MHKILAYLEKKSYLCTDFSHSYRTIHIVFKRPMKKLNLYYYLMMALALIAAGGSYYLVMHDLITPIDPLSGTGMAIQYAIILDALLTIPGGLFLMKRVCARLCTYEDQKKQEAEYIRYATWRILLVSNSMVLAIAAFYLLGAYQSMIWVAAISAIGWYFTKPSEAKMAHELAPRDPNEETY